MAKGLDMEKTRLGESGDVLIKFEIRVKSYTKELDMVGKGYLVLPATLIDELDGTA